jgi:hypothetical protein
MSPLVRRRKRHRRAGRKAEIRRHQERAQPSNHRQTLIHQSLSCSIVVLALTADPVWGQKTAQKTEILAGKTGQKIDQQT